ncbi:MAG: capsular biosynthesis protein, partial [Pseudomonadota bacterium]
GLSALSRFPVDPSQIKAIAGRCAPVDFAPRWRDRSWPLILGEIRFTLFNALAFRRFPHYISHRGASPMKVYSGWLAGRLRDALRRKDALQMPSAPFFVFALQLEGDLQLREHSPFGSAAETVDHVADSFAAYAPADAQLLLKPHPHEFGRRRLLEAISSAGERYGLGARMSVIEDRTIAALCQGAKGFVTINSSAGIEALRAGCPVHTVLPTIYDVSGLTHQGSLDQFWAAPSVPDATLFDDFCQALAGTAQVRGTIYHPEGCRTAARGIADRVIAGGTLDGLVNAENDEGSQPRLTKAVAMGVRYD